MRAFAISGSETSSWWSPSARPTGDEALLIRAAA
jgi:hypothetical protein